MRTFLISLSLFLAVIGLCLWSFFSNSHDITILYGLAEAIPQPSTEEMLATPQLAEALAATRSFWNEKARLFTISITKHSLATIEVALTQAETYAEAKDLPSFLAARAELLLAITRLHALERTVL